MQNTIHLELQNTLPQPSTDICFIIGAFTDLSLTAVGSDLDQQSQGYLSRILKRGDLRTETGEMLFLSELPVVNSRVLLVSCGDKSKLSPAIYRKILQKSAQAMQNIAAKKFYCELPSLNINGYDLKTKLFHAASSILSAYYRFTQCKSQPAKTAMPQNIILQADDNAENQKVLARAQAYCDGLKLIKDLANLPANICTPTYLAEQAKLVSKNYPAIRCTVLEEADMEKLGMGALLAVSIGSQQRAKLICLQYNGAENPHQKPIIFVGKGVTFDTGGISIKGAAALDEMKYDMCGGATVLGLLQTVAQIKLPINIIGIVPAVENMPDGQATRPGDIVKTLSGQTVEILNTDAEGRLILCDALTYAEQFNPEIVIDLATLTGGVIMTFGHIATGIMGNNQPLIQELLSIANECGERAWELPLWDEYQEMLSSNFADIANIASHNDAKTILGAIFLSRFANYCPWVHMDIAGTAWNSGKDKGATGRPLLLLLNYLLKKAG